MKKMLLISTLLMPGISFADLGANYPVVSDSTHEFDAKTGAAGLGVTTIYDHTNQAPNGQFYVPVEYNRPGNPGAGEQDPNSAVNTTDIDYIPLNQLKGTNGAAGTNGINGTTGAKGTMGNTGSTGATGERGPQGVPGRDASAPTIDPRLDVEVREYDAKHWSISSYASFGMQSGTSRYIVGQRLTLKLGSSYEAKQLDALNRKLEALQDNLNVMKIIP